MTIISPAHLRARREALGVTRETVAAFSPPGTKATTIRDLERPRCGRWHRWHVEALDKIEAWFGEHAGAVGIWIAGTARSSCINGAQTLWAYSDEAFKRCPIQHLCLGIADLYKVCLGDVRATLIDDGNEIIDAEFIPDAFDEFRAGLGTDSHHPELMAKWWRHFTKTYKEMP